MSGWEAATLTISVSLCSLAREDCPANTPAGSKRNGERRFGKDVQRVVHINRNLIRIGSKRLFEGHFLQPVTVGGRNKAIPGD